MRYGSIEKATFLSRPNRFIAKVLLNGTEETVHVKNTGRCRELLVPGAQVILSKGGANRKTEYDLVSVYKGGRLVNMDSQAANRIAEEYILKTFGCVNALYREKTFGLSRLDFFGHQSSDEFKRELFPGYEGSFYLEVKGVTLERDNIAYFPDAPTERGIKHIRELINVKKAGLEAALMFVVQMDGIQRVEPNRETHPAFAEAMLDAQKAGVTFLAVECTTSPGVVEAIREIPVWA